MGFLPLVRRFLAFLCLLVGLNLLVESAHPPLACAAQVAPSSQSLPDENEPLAGEPVLSPITPHQESAWFSPDAELRGFLNHPLLVTGEPALVQLHLGDVAHGRWQRFGIAPTAPFTFSRTLPLQI